MLSRGPRRAALRGFLPRRNTVHPVFSARDPWPLLTSLSKLVRQVSRRSAGSAPVPVGRRTQEGVTEG
jgi:hypothetical protein